MKKEKWATEMEFEEFVTWATREIFDGLITGGGKEMKSRVHVVMQQAALNEVWGGNRKIKS